MDCRETGTEPVEVQLPAAWEASERYTVITVTIAACPEHASELRARAAALLAARADLHAVLTVVDDALPAERDLRRQAEVAEAHLGLAADRAEYAEAALRLLEEELLPGRLNHHVADARHATGVDLVRVLERELEIELGAGVQGEVALGRVRRLATEILAKRPRLARTRR